jgi:hypothetical protein
LVGKGADQLDLPLGERLDAMPSERYHSYRVSLPHKWDPER